MADVRPFRGLRYSEPLEAVVAPPYDVLTKDQVAEYRAHSPHNVVRLTRPGDDYEGAARLLEEWQAEGVLVEEPEPAMYVHETAYDPPHEATGLRGDPGDGRRRLDLLAVLRLEPYEARAVLPHERTHRGPKQDRLALLRATAASLEPLWFLAEGLRGLLESAPTSQARRFQYAGERHTLRTVTDPAWIRAASGALAAREVLIADGHHRYETTLAYSQEVDGGPDAAARFTLALITDLADPGLVVLPTHRLLKAGVAVTGGEPAASLEETLSALRGRVAAGAYRDGRYQVLPLEGEVAAMELHRQVIDNVLGKRDPEEYLAYTRDPREAVRWVDSGAGVAAFLLDAPDLGAVLKVAREGTTMPQKTTYFFPKPPSGMVFHRLDSERSP
jgi:uncharacterized protein (DUF1015 family)